MISFVFPNEASTIPEDDTTPEVDIPVEDTTPENTAFPSAFIDSRGVSVWTFTFPEAVVKKSSFEP